MVGIQHQVDEVKVKEDDWPNCERLGFIHKKKPMHGFCDNIEKRTLENTDFRRVLYTGKYSQLVLMHLRPLEEIGLEVHEDTDQFFRVESGTGTVVIDGAITPLSDGAAVLVPAGAYHNISNTSATQPLLLYTLYAPAHHQDGVAFATKADAEASDEHFDGTTTE